MCKKQVCLEIISFIKMKIRGEMKNRSQRYDINRTRPTHDYKYTKYKMCLSMTMVICSKQHLRNIWNWIHEKVKQHSEAESKKSVAYKKLCICFSILKSFRNYVWKTNEGEAESIMLIFVLWRCFNSRWVRVGGVGQKVLFKDSWDPIFFQPEF